VTLRLVPFDAGIDVDALSASLAPGFGGDEGAARETLAQTVALLTAHPRPAPWGSYIAYEGELAVGLCAFKAAPDAEGRVEIAYFTFPGFEGRGHASAMAAALVDLAAGGGASLAVAHTLPEDNASNRALKRNGFAFAGDVVDPEDGPVWRWERRLRA
jgi:RimJ/RimL family protein N-acetyltransferase